MPTRADEIRTIDDYKADSVELNDAPYTVGQAENFVFTVQSQRMK